MQIRECRSGEKMPMELLLLADPSEALVNEYLKTGICYIGEEDGRAVAAGVVVDEGEGTAELINVAVDESMQGKGFGKAMVLFMIEDARKKGFKRIEVGTGNSSLMQMALYQKCGFRMHEIRKNFFIDNYDEVIMENGLRCSDMVRLAIDF